MWLSLPRTVVSQIEEGYSMGEKARQGVAFLAINAEVIARTAAMPWTLLEVAAETLAAASSEMLASQLDFGPV